MSTESHGVYKGVAEGRVESWLAGEYPDPSVIVIHPTFHCSAGCPYCYMREPWSDRTIAASMLAPGAWLQRMRELSDFHFDLLILAGGGEPTDFEMFAELCSLISEVPVKRKLFSNGFGRFAGDLPDNAYLFESISFNLRAIILRKRVTAVRDLVARIRARNAEVRLNAILVEATIEDLRHRLTPEVTAFVGDLNSVILSPEWREDVPPIDAAHATALCEERGISRLRLMETDLAPARKSDGQIYCGSRFLDMTIGRDLGIYPCCEYSYRPGYKLADFSGPRRLRTQWAQFVGKQHSGNRPVGCSSCFFGSLNRLLYKRDPKREER